MARAGVVAERLFFQITTLPALLVMLGVTAVPFAITIGLSLTDFHLINPTWGFVGFDNFRAMLSDRQLPTILFNTFYVVISLAVGGVGGGLALALLLNSQFPAARAVRTIYIVPVMTAGIVVAISWRAMLNNDSGWINYLLGQVGLPQPTWLGSPALAIPSVLIATLWTAIPFQAMIIYSGFGAVSDELKEASYVDGAGPLSRFRHVILPAIRPVLSIAFILELIDAFRLFEQIQVLTGGGPGISSTTLNVHIYSVGITYDRLGYASAMGVLLVALVGITVGGVGWLLLRMK